MKFSDVLIKTLRGEQGKTDLKTPRIVRNAHYSFVGKSKLPTFFMIMYGRPRSITKSKADCNFQIITLRDLELKSFRSGNTRLLLWKRQDTWFSPMLGFKLRWTSIWKLCWAIG